MTHQTPLISLLVVTVFRALHGFKSRLQMRRHERHRTPVLPVLISKFAELPSYLFNSVVIKCALHVALNELHALA